MARPRKDQSSNSGGVAVEEREVTADSILQFLTDTFSGQKRIDALAVHLSKNKGVSAEDVYYWIEKNPLFGLGTIRKVGKFVFGSEFEPGSISEQAPEEQLSFYKQEAANLRRALQDSERNRAMLAAKLELLERKKWNAQDEQRLQDIAEGRTAGSSQMVGIETE